MAQSWLHVDGNQKPLRHGVKYIYNKNGIHLEGFLMWTAKHGYVLQYEVRRSGMVVQQQSSIPFEQKSNRVLVYEGLKAVEMNP